MLLSSCALTIISVTVVCLLTPDLITRVMAAVKYASRRHFACYIPCHTFFRETTLKKESFLTLQKWMQLGCIQKWGFKDLICGTLKLPKSVFRLHLVFWNAIIVGFENPQLVCWKTHTRCIQQPLVFQTTRPTG
jgi:hypothetical protein